MMIRKSSLKGAFLNKMEIVWNYMKNGWNLIVISGFVDGDYFRVDRIAYVP